MISRSTIRSTWQFPQGIVLLAAILGSVCMMAQDRVRIKGRGLSKPGVHAPLNLTMVIGDSLCVRVRLTRGGRFDIASEDDQQYLLRFERSGAITKVIRVDTHHAERKAGTKRRTIEFDVVMEPVGADRRYRYDGPVGRIAFHRSNGRQEVEHTYVREPLAVEEVLEEW